jgi:hypothetical protein
MMMVIDIFHRQHNSKFLPNFDRAHHVRDTKITGEKKREVEVFICLKFSEYLASCYEGI